MWPLPERPSHSTNINLPPWKKDLGFNPSLSLSAPDDFVIGGWRILLTVYLCLDVSIVLMAERTPNILWIAHFVWPALNSPDVRKPVKISSDGLSLLSLQALSPDLCKSVSRAGSLQFSLSKFPSADTVWPNFLLLEKREISVETSDNGFSSPSPGVWGIDGCTPPARASRLSLAASACCHFQGQEREGWGGGRASCPFCVYFSPVKCRSTHF